MLKDQVISGNLLSMIERDVHDGGGEHSESDAVSESEESTDVELAVGFVAGDIEGEGGLVEDAGDVVFFARVIKCTG